MTAPIDHARRNRLLRVAAESRLPPRPTRAPRPKHLRAVKRCLTAPVAWTEDERGFLAGLNSLGALAEKQKARLAALVERVPEKPRQRRRQSHRTATAAED